jgi:hypothetical protein
VLSQCGAELDDVHVEIVQEPCVALRVDPPGQPAERLLGPVVVTLLAERRRNGALGDVHEISLQESYVDRVDRDRSYIGVPGSA